MKSYKIYKNSISKKSSKLFFNFVLDLICSYEKNFQKKINYTGWDDYNFNRNLIKLRKNKKNVFSAIYDSIQNSNVLQKIPFENNLHKVASKFLNVNESKLTIRSVSFRLDPPNDKRNSYDWHQDSAYDKFNVDSKNGALLWIPLVNTSKKNGTLIVKLGSEQSTYHCSKLTKKGTKYRSEQILVEKKYLKKFKSKQISVKQNNALTTFIGLFHKSGINTSNKFRFTIIVRYGNLFTNDFVSRRKLKGEDATLSF